MRQTRQSFLKDGLATAEVIFSLGQSEAQAIAAELSGGHRTEFAAAFCTTVLAALWKKRLEVVACKWDLRPPILVPIKSFPGLVERISGALAVLPAARAGFLLGQIYTALLPEEVRKALGAYYTPPALVERLFQMITEHGFNWRTGRIVDPACGGAAFLASVAPLLERASNHESPSSVLEDIERRLVGIEIDAFAAWMSMVLLDLSLLRLSVNAGRPVAKLVIAKDAFRVPTHDLGHFDLVIGNPPYGRVRLTGTQRDRFRDSLFGHANLYGLFTELAVRLTKPGGLIAYVTPTSFLGGEYFKKLRSFLAKDAPLQRVEFLADREGVFSGVLQETMLTLFTRNGACSREPVAINVIETRDSAESVKVHPVGKVGLDSIKGAPWLLPRSAGQLDLIHSLNRMPHRLNDYGFAVSTGQLVWNRHKDQLRSGHGRECYPIIWAEAVAVNGTFRFQATRRSHLPYLQVKGCQGFLINHEPCILVQRTTAKEQKRRLIAAVIPNSFVVEYPGFIVENHLNMIYSLHPKPRISLRILALLLNSPTVDQAFRCINGSVAVSAYELNALPLPSLDQMRYLQQSLLQGSPAQIETLIAKFYNYASTPTIAASADGSSLGNSEVAA